MALEKIRYYDLNKYKGTYISRSDLLSSTGKHRFICAMCYNTTHCNRSHSIGTDKTWDTSLYTKVCTLVSSMSKCTGIRISSGYRSPGYGGHDICVGGTGSGPHTTGQAIDISFTKNGGNLNCRQVAVIVESCKLFNGIAPISNGRDNGYIHLDTKGRTWHGDEYYIGYSGGVKIGFLNYYKNKGLSGFNSLDRVKWDLGWNGAVNPNLPDQIGAGSGSSFDLTGDITITVKGDSSKSSLKSERPYFATYTGSSSVLKYALKELGEASVDWYIQSIAHVNGIKSYSGTLTEDATLMALLRQGKLVRP